MNWHHPILSCNESKRFEDALFAGDIRQSTAAMERAGRALGQQLLEDLGVRLCGPQKLGLLLLGKGHNAGDALIAILELMTSLPQLKIDVFQVLGDAEINPTVRPWLDLVLSNDRVRVLDDVAAANRVYDFSVDGVFGMQFRPPMKADVAACFEQISKLSIGVRIAVDLPSGVNDDTHVHALRADFTYATGIFKKPLVQQENLGVVGRLRYLDLGFFDHEEVATAIRVVSPTMMKRAHRELRPVVSDKRTFGHLLIVAGSRKMPGALLMAVVAAVQSGVGLLTVVAPRSLVPQLCAVVPEAMWLPWEETPDGALSLEGVSVLQGFRKRITSVLMGPGCGTEPETQALLDDVLDLFDVPVVLDADALTRTRIERLKQRRGPCVLTPHEGELLRISGMSAEQLEDDSSLLDFSASLGNESIVVFKGALTRMSDGSGFLYFPMGNPMLARGGSGDILAGLVAGKIAIDGNKCLMSSVAKGISSHGNAADRLFSKKEETHARTTDILKFLNSY